MAANKLLEKFIVKRKIGFVVRTRYLLLVDILGILLAFGLSHGILRESLRDVFEFIGTYWLQVFIFLLIKLFINGNFGLYSRIWRYASILEVVHIIKSALFSAIILAVVSYLLFPLFKQVRVASVSFYILDFLLYLVMLSSSRFFLRITVNWKISNDKSVSGNPSHNRHVLIVGAGNDGQKMIRNLAENPELGITSVGVVDDDLKNQGMLIHNNSVIGQTKDIPHLVNEMHIDEVIATLSINQQDDIDRIHNICVKAGVAMRVAPSFGDLLPGHFSIDNIRKWRTSEVIEPHQEPPECTFTVHNILVTGGAGFIGSNFIRYFLEKYPQYRIIAFDKLTYAGHPDNLRSLAKKYSGQFIFEKGDITKPDELTLMMQRYEIDAIINFAAETHVDRSLISSEAFVHSNFLGTYCLLEAAKKYKVTRYHQVSTDEVYGQVLYGSFLEDDPLVTSSPYSATKASADLLVNAYFVSHGVQATITRGSNNIGPYQYPEKAVPLFITNALENEPLPVYGDGLYVRDYQYVLDHCMGIDLVFHKGQPGEIYNLGSGNEVEAIRLANMIVDRLGKPRSLIYMVKDRKGQDRRYSLDCNKIRSLGWKPKWDFDTALDSTIAWYIDNEWWWRMRKQGEYKNFYGFQYQERVKQ